MALHFAADWCGLVRVAGMAPQANMRLVEVGIVFVFFGFGGLAYHLLCISFRFPLYSQLKVKVKVKVLFS